MGEGSIYYDRVFIETSLETARCARAAKTNEKRSKYAEVVNCSLIAQFGLLDQNNAIYCQAVRRESTVDSVRAFEARCVNKNVPEEAELQQLEGGHGDATGDARGFQP